MYSSKLLKIKPFIKFHRLKFIYSNSPIEELKILAVNKNDCQYTAASIFRDKQKRNIFLHGGEFHSRLFRIINEFNDWKELERFSFLVEEEFCLSSEKDNSLTNSFDNNRMSWLKEYYSMAQMISKKVYMSSIEKYPNLWNPKINALYYPVDTRYPSENVENKFIILFDPNYVPQYMMTPLGYLPIIDSPVYFGKIISYKNIFHSLVEDLNHSLKGKIIIANDSRIYYYIETKNVPEAKVSKNSIFYLNTLWKKFKPNIRLASIKSF